MLGSKHKPPPCDPEAGSPVVISASSISPRSIEHLWPGVLYIGKPTLLVGDPGLGKSLVTTDIAARVSRGNAWPLGAENAAAGDVLMCSAEDDPGDTIVPRLMAAGADLSRVAFFDGVREKTEDGGMAIRALSLDRHLGQLQEVAAAKRGALRLVIVDPVTAFLGGADSYKNGEIRALIAGLARIATDYRFAVLVVSHLNKGTGASAIYRISGSLAFVAAARAAFAVVRDPNDPARRLVLPVKNNLAADTFGFSYSINVADNDAPYIAWGEEAVTEETADEVLGGMPITARQEAINADVRAVCEWLKEALAIEAQPAVNMWRISEQKGFSRRDVERAKKQLGIRAAAKGFAGAWHWELPR
jgi:putative DNA primase/helicase